MSIFKTAEAVAAGELDHIAAKFVLDKVFRVGNPNYLPPDSSVYSENTTQICVLERDDTPHSIIGVGRDMRVARYDETWTFLSVYRYDNGLYVETSRLSTTMFKDYTIMDHADFYKLFSAGQSPQVCSRLPRYVHDHIYVVTMTIMACDTMMSCDHDARPIEVQVALVPSSYWGVSYSELIIRMPSINYIYDPCIKSSL